MLYFNVRILVLYYKLMITSKDLFLHIYPLNKSKAKKAIRLPSGRTSWNLQKRFTNTLYS